MGQDLHDDISSLLASNLHLIQMAQGKSNIEDINKLLHDIETRTHDIYHSVRNKSHSMHQFGNNTDDDLFETSIHTIVNTALPDSDYKKEIDIDASASFELNFTARIEVLRILQEAMANIVKHAKKANEAFVFLSQITH